MLSQLYPARAALQPNSVLKEMPARDFFCDKTLISHTFLVFEKIFRACRPRYIFKNWFKECQDVLLLTEMSCSIYPLLR